MRFSTTSGRRSATTIKKNNPYTLFRRDAGKFLLCLVYTPVGHQVTSVLCSVRKSNHDSLGFISSFQVRPVIGIGIQSIHDGSRLMQVIHRFKKRDDIKV